MNKRAIIYSVDNENKSGQNIKRKFVNNVPDSPDVAFVRERTVCASDNTAAHNNVIIVNSERKLGIDNRRQLKANAFFRLRPLQGNNPKMQATYNIPSIDCWKPSSFFGYKLIPYNNN